jgi:hypothetical protein
MSFAAARVSARRPRITHAATAALGVLDSSTRFLKSVCVETPARRTRAYSRLTARRAFSSSWTERVAILRPRASVITDSLLFTARAVTRWASPHSMNDGHQRATCDGRNGHGAWRRPFLLVVRARLAWPAACCQAGRDARCGPRARGRAFDHEDKRVRRWPSASGAPGLPHRDWYESL